MPYKFDISPTEFTMLRDFVCQNFGIFFKDERRSLVRMKLYPRVLSLGFSSFGEYFHYLKYGRERVAEQRKMIALLTNNETYFFREYAQLEVLRDHLIPLRKTVNRNGRDKSFTILHAGCSTGEEVYSVAIMAYESGQFIGDWDLRVIGVDVSETALRVARSGEYEERSFRLADPDYVKRYFNESSGRYRVREYIGKMTAFERHNIVGPEFTEAFSKVDVVLCRNVFIYFPDERIKRAVDHFHSVLKPGGYLLLGHSETLTGISGDFDPERYAKAIVYKKKER
jgi:chemotaxis protein methyltransferase CheR